MPETTKTAEDKLMADIAEAMTGSPLSLGSREAPAPYNLPENFFNDTNSDSSQQSAEEKLLANIAQAMSESPLSVARDIANQNLERDLNIFDEDYQLPLFPIREQPLTEEFNFSDKPEAEVEPEQISEPTQDNSVLIKEIDTEAENNDSDNHEEEPELVSEAAPEPEPVPEAEIESPPPPEPIPEPEPDLIQETEEVNNAENVDVEADEKLASLVKEFEQLEQDEQTEQAETESEADEHIDDKIEEVTTESNMPEKSLLEDDDESTTETTSDIGIKEEISDYDEEDDDDFDIASLGALSEATSMPEYEEPESEPAPEESYMPENISEQEEIKDDEESEENEEKEKVMGIREKLASRKNGTTKDSPAATKKSGKSNGILLPILLTVLAVIGGFILWQLMQLNDRLTSSMMNYGATSFDSASGYYDANPSYDYAVDFIFDTNLTERMAQRGHEGWQVVGSRRTQDSVTGQLGYEFIFMRRTPGR